MEFNFVLNFIDNEIQVVVDNSTSYTIYFEGQDFDFSAFESIENEIVQQKLKTAVRALAALENEI